MMRTAAIRAIAGHLPEAVLSNDELSRLYPDWPADRILEKTGIGLRHIAEEGETAADLAYEAARKLFDGCSVDAGTVDFLLFCTQAPDHFLPTTACLLQSRLGLREDIGALDYNLGCSGFVYGLALAKGLIETSSATKVLVLTADTYSKFIHPLDKSVRTLFGDGAAATLVEAIDHEEPMIGPFVFGTDGTGASRLIVSTGAARQARSAETAVAHTDPSGNVRSDDNLYMDGPAIMAFTLSAVPAAVKQLCSISRRALDGYDGFVFHQANAFILGKLRQKLKIDAARFVIDLKDTGNTVSSSIPLALEPLLRGGTGTSRHFMLVGFGVGYSWAVI